MAGYVWSGRVRAVTASWAVPRMSGPGEAHASTWIGAQAPGRSQHSPFIQVGTVEDRRSSARRLRGVLDRHGARLSPADPLPRSSRRRRVHGADPGGGPLAGLHRRHHIGAEDLVSDQRGGPRATSTSPSGSRRTRPRRRARRRRYPGLSPVRMSALAVNGAAPRYGDVFAQWMSLPGRDLAPTPLRDRAFAITRGVLTVAGRRYLEIARPQNVERTQGRPRGGRSGPSTPRRARSSA